MLERALTEITPRFDLPSHRPHVFFAHTLFMLTAGACAAAISRGGVCVMPNWLGGTILDELRADMRQLLEDGAFHESGLTQKLGPDSPSTENDRRERLVCEMRPDLGGNLAAREAIDARLEKLRCDLEASTSRKLSL